MRDLLPSMGLAIAGTLVLATIQLAPRDGRNVLVVFPPGTPTTDALIGVIEAGWRPVSTPSASVVLAAPDGVATRRPAGAWAVLDAMGLTGCR